MFRYRAEITGEGFYIDSGAKLPETKTIHYEFSAKNKKEATTKTDQFAHSKEIKEKFWMTDLNLKVTILRIENKDGQTEERSYLA